MQQTDTKKIMVVDDDDDIRDIITQVLEMDGYQVTALDNGHHVLEMIRKEQPGLILLDIMLGDTDGREICRTIQADPGHKAIPVILVSAGQQFEDHEFARCHPAAFIAKPFNINVLLAQVKQFVQ